MAKILSINTSKRKGTPKSPIESAEVDALGIVGDAHAGPWHRQLSILSRESIAEFERESRQTYACGEFAENLTTEGLDLRGVALFDRLHVGDVELEVTQIGKTCHGDGCAIFRAVGRCVMPKEGIFARVVNGGALRAGDTVRHVPRALRVHVLTLSDRASRGAYPDRSGPAIEKAVHKHFCEARWHLEVKGEILPDEAEALQQAVAQVLERKIDVLFTTGGTGIGPRDITPDVIGPLLDKELTGLMDFVRMKHGERLPSALLSRALAGVAKQTLVYALPGSVRAVHEYLDVILPTLEHSLLMLRGVDAH
jgi:molybdenum cofactor synthesis domain-containing protein